MPILTSKKATSSLCSLCPESKEPPNCKPTRKHCRSWTKPLALAGYCADHGEYPEKIDSLVPKYLAAVPDDSHDPEGFKLQYRREGEAYVFWSVGCDGVDDNGRTADDHPAGDDEVINPLPQKLRLKIARFRFFLRTTLVWSRCVSPTPPRIRG